MNSTHINEFPCELLLHIFTFLSPTSVCICERVCHLWREVAADSRLWKGFAAQLPLFFDKKDLTEEGNLKSRVMGVILSAKQQIKESSEIPPLQRWRLELFDNWIHYLRMESIIMYRTASPFPRILKKKAEAMERERKRKEAVNLAKLHQLALSLVGESEKIDEDKSSSKPHGKEVQSNAIALMSGNLSL